MHLARKNDGPATGFLGFSANGLGGLALVIGWLLVGPVHAEKATGPLRVHPENPRYFIDGNGKAIRLAGHQIFCDVQDNNFLKEYTYGKKRALDWAWYLDFAAERHLNYLRNWAIWSTGKGVNDPRRTAHPMMYQRTGPGKAKDGRPKFDLHRFDPEYFDRLRTRVQQAGERGIYVAIMLFEPYGFGPEGYDFWSGNVFNPHNNINGVNLDANGDGWGLEFFYANDPATRALQYAYVDKVIDTVNDLDNVLYEVANELYATEWQYDIIRHVHSYEATKPKQHLVYMSPGGVIPGPGGPYGRNWKDHTAAQLLEGPADCIGVKLSPREVFLSDPPVAAATKPLLWDNDHGLAPVNPCPHQVPWMAFLRGYHFNLYDGPFEAPEQESDEWDRTRFNIGATVRYAERCRDLSRMNPQNSLASTGFCLADPGQEYLVYLPKGGEVSVDLSGAQGGLAVEWFSPLTRETRVGDKVDGGSKRSFRAPFDGDSVLCLTAHTGDHP